MKKLSTILRPLLLVVLMGWLGIVQPAAAQQTVTLSGRVTDSAGNAVPGVTVYLHPPAGLCLYRRQDTDGEWAYRFSVRQGPTIFRWSRMARSFPKGAS